MVHVQFPRIWKQPTHQRCSQVLLEQRARRGGKNTIDKPQSPLKTVVPTWTSKHTVEKKTATPKVTSYREDSDRDFSSPSPSDDEIIPKAQKDQNQTTPEHPIWVEPPSIKDGEIQYKCRVCPRTFCTRGYCAKHFNNHPTYLP